RAATNKVGHRKRSDLLCASFVVMPRASHYVNFYRTNSSRKRTRCRAGLSRRYWEPKRGSPCSFFTHSAAAAPSPRFQSTPTPETSTLENYKLQNEPICP